MEKILTPARFTGKHPINVGSLDGKTLEGKMLIPK